jgi:DNA replication protein DnaC
VSDGTADASDSRPLPSRNDVHYVADSTGIGKTWLARAFAQKACREGYAALFLKAAELFREYATARADGSQPKLSDRLGRVDLLIVDDWAMAPMTEIERAATFWKFVTRAIRRDLRCRPANCRLAPGTPNPRSDYRDSILDRVVHNAHRIEMRGESVRKKRGGKNGKEI